MANTFGILTALVLLFSAFVAYKNKAEYSEKILETENEVTKRDRNKRTYEDLVEEGKALDSEKDVANKSRDEFAEKLEAQEDKNNEVFSQSEAAEKELAETTERLAAKKKELEESGEMEGLVSEIERITISTQELEDKLAILNTQNSRLRAKNTDSSSRLTAIKKKLSDMKSGRSLPDMKTKISSISRTLGFVTLAGGVNSGVIGGSKVAVMRGSEKIAELNITAVSPNTATADVIQSTLKKGETVSVGDTVIPVEVAPAS